MVGFAQYFAVGHRRFADSVCRQSVLPLFCAGRPTLKRSKIRLQLGLRLHWPMQATMQCPMPPGRCCLSRKQQLRQGNQQTRRMASCTCRCGKRSKWRSKTISISRSNRSISRLQKESVPLAQGGGLPRAINYTIMDAPAGVGGAAVPLLSYSSPGLAPASVDPISSTVSSSYNTSRVLETSHSLALGTNSYSAGSLVPGFDAQLLGRYGWLRRNPQISLLTGTPSSGTAEDTVTTDNTLGDTTLTKAFSPGTTIELGVNDFVQSFYSGRSSAVPFCTPMHTR